MTILRRPDDMKIVAPLLFTFSFTDAVPYCRKYAKPSSLYQPYAPAFAAPRPQHGGVRPAPRRILPKREGGGENARRRRGRRQRSRDDVGGIDDEDDPFPWDTAESRPLVRSVRIERGEDYYIQEQVQWNDGVGGSTDVTRELHPALLTKLKEELVGPYVDNHIGWITVFVLGVVVAFKFLLPKEVFDGGPHRKYSKIFVGE
eukprot:CAMPEP_0194280876 /NCGR_PEP_ID=MMETSP0169-20130528/19115_1 /TAXON_ID=218684 /ORGANISM="Corethron pennatum, Strain L29A3" /LENGTH=201 /DNA_ID=CAMNT_0039025769 /DNA_START=74 /DNA_END=675 /DNA_ORIENTATION=-